MTDGVGNKYRLILLPLLAERSAWHMIVHGWKIMPTSSFDAFDIVFSLEGECIAVRFTAPCEMNK